MMPDPQVMYDSVPELPRSWYQDGQDAAAAQVAAECATDLHQNEVLAQHGPIVGRGR